MLYIGNYLVNRRIYDYRKREVIGLMIGVCVYMVVVGKIAGVIEGEVVKNIVAGWDFIEITRGKGEVYLDIIGYTIKEITENNLYYIAAFMSEGIYYVDEIAGVQKTAGWEPLVSKRTIIVGMIEMGMKVTAILAVVVSSMYMGGKEIRKGFLKENKRDVEMAETIEEEVDVYDSISYRFVIVTMLVLIYVSLRGHLMYVQLIVVGKGWHNLWGNIDRDEVGFMNGCSYMPVIGENRGIAGMKEMIIERVVYPYKYMTYVVEGMKYDGYMGIKSIIRVIKEITI